MDDPSDAHIPYEELFERSNTAVTDEECKGCIAEIERALESVSATAGRARLLMCRARVHSNQWRTAEVCDDAKAAMSLFERAGERDMAAEAASWAAAHASRLGELSLAAELATKSLLALESVTNDRLRLEIFNRLGIFCYSFLDYDRAIVQFEASLAAAERTGDHDKVCRQLHNIADGLLVAARQRQLADVEPASEGLARAEGIVRRLLNLATDEFNRRTASHRLLAEVLCELGRVDEAVAVLDQFRHNADGIAPAAQRAALAWIEARCLRIAGQPERAVSEAARAVAIAEDSGDDHELMLALEEFAASQEAAGDISGALATAREVKARMWKIHRRQTQQLVQDVWARADLVRDQRNLQFQAAEASRWAEEDVLTGLGNRRMLEHFLRDGAQDQQQLAFIIVDVDRFKEINDTFGHDLGDAVLRKLGDVLRHQVRAGQVAVRYGGDEFVLGLPGVNVSAAAAFAERLRRTIEASDWAALAPGLQVTTSHGAACGAVSRWQAVLAAADSALYAAKRHGRNMVSTAPAAAHAS